MKSIFILNNKEITKLERFVRKRVEQIVFNETRRDKEKVKSGHYIDDASGDLRKTIRRAKNFITQNKSGIVIDFPTTDYFKYLDDSRREELNWYLSEAIFEDEDLREYLIELFEDSATRTAINILT